VQVRALSVAHREGSAQRLGRFRRHAARLDPHPGLGLHGRDQIHGAADAPRRDGRLGRGEACRPRHARLHDRHRTSAAARPMNGVHDMGGMDGFGKVEPEAAEPTFHAAWEGRVLGMSRALGATGEWTIDVGRYWIELLPAHIYLASSYYERWFRRLENLCVA